MLLPGRLNNTTLGDVLGQLHRARASGVLELVEVRGATSGRVHRIHLASGLVAHVESALRVPRLGELLRREGLLTDEGVRHLARPPGGRRAGELLVDSGLASERLVSAALRRQLRLRLDALFSIEEAQLRFRAFVRGLPAASSVPLSPHEFLHGRPRARKAARAASTPEPAPAARRRDPARSWALSALGLGAEASSSDVRVAFRRLAREVHPDRHPRATAAERAELLTRFARLSAAYHQLVA
ncbi:MAG: DnaJ domain-containing protein [Polyangiaceae bacterium]|nr:DnaJ domain-containing protein [Polyangiaceae bacterium]